MQHTAHTTACLALAVGTLPASAALVAHYDFEETTGGSGTTIADQSGNGRDLTFVGSAGLNEPGVFGSGINFSTGGALTRSGSSFFSPATITSLNAVTGNQVTLAFWAQPASESIGSNPFYLNDSNSGPGNRIAGSHLEWTTGDIFWDAAWDVNTSNRVSAAGGTTADAYHHYVYTYDGDAGTMALYKDNAVLASGSVPGGNFNWSAIQNFELGANSFTAGWNGTMDDFGLWNQMLTTTEIDYIFNNGVPEPASALLVAAGSLLIAGRRRRA